MKFRYVVILFKEQLRFASFPNGLLFYSCRIGVITKKGEAKPLQSARDRAQTNTFYLIDFEKFTQTEFPKLQKFLQNRFNERWLI